MRWGYRSYKYNIGQKKFFFKYFVRTVKCIIRVLLYWNSWASPLFVFFFFYCGQREINEHERAAFIGNLYLKKKIKKYIAKMTRETIIIFLFIYNKPPPPPPPMNVQRYCYYCYYLISVAVCKKKKANKRRFLYF